VSKDYLQGDKTPHRYNNRVGGSNDSEWVDWPRRYRPSSWPNLSDPIDVDPAAKSVWMYYESMDEEDRDESTKPDLPPTVVGGRCCCSLVSSLLLSLTSWNDFGQIRPTTCETV
jgi:hypothetical protein